MAYDDVIRPGASWLIHTDRWRLNAGEGTPWSPDYRKLRHGGAPTGRWFQIYPQAGSAHTAHGPATCSITGPRKYLTA